MMDPPSFSQKASPGFEAYLVLFPVLSTSLIAILDVLLTSSHQNQTPAFLSSLNFPVFFLTQVSGTVLTFTGALQHLLCSMFYLQFSR